VRKQCDFKWATVLSVFVKFVFFFCVQNIKYFSIKIGRMIVRFVIYMEVFFLKIFDTFLKIQKRAPRCLRSKAIF
jgi:hypothetical protein